MRLKMSLLMAAVALVLTCAVCFLMVFFPNRMDALATRWAENRAAAVATLVSGPLVKADDAAGLTAALENLQSIADVTYAWVQDEAGNRIATYRPNDAPQEATPAAPMAPGFHVMEDRLEVVQDLLSLRGGKATLVIGFDVTDLQADKQHNAFVGGAVAAIILALGLGLSVLVGVTLARPITQLASITAEVVRTGDLTRSVEMIRTDELGMLASNVGQMLAQQRTIISRLIKLIHNISSTVIRISEAGGGVATGGARIQDRVESTSSAAIDMLNSLQTLAGDVDALEHNAENSSASLVQMAASNREVSENVQTMADSAKLTSVAVERMGGSINEIALSIKQLNSTITETSSSVQRMDTAISEVERNTKETARLGERVSSNAEIGVESLQKTLEGIDNIKDSAQAAAAVISNLGQRISDIGAILRVIDEVAAQTKLLSLNAAIIAAQAGEHGRGFSVVADQIKELAQRTGASTREISTLIAGIQEESRNATHAMAVGVSNVDVGVRLGNEAASALEKIRQSANESTAMIRKIAQFTQDQSRGSKQITTAIERIAQSVAHISSFSTEQARGAEQIIASSKNMDLLTEQVRRSSEEQSQGSTQVIEAIETINEMVTRLSAAQREQRAGAEIVQHNVEDIRGVAQTQMVAVRELEEALISLDSEAKALQAEVRHYKL